MHLETANVSPGDWIIISGHNPTDLRPRMIQVGDAPPQQALFEGGRMMVRCPEVHQRATVLVDGERVGSLVSTPK